MVAAMVVYRGFWLPLDVIRFGLNVRTYSRLPHGKGFWGIVVRLKSANNVSCGFFSGGIIYLV